MSVILGFDTETTGIPLWNDPSEDPRQPYITELAAKLVDEETRKVVGSMNVLIKPEGWTIEEEAGAVTGITVEDCQRYGVPLPQALEMFVAMWRKADLRAAHNEPFDNRILRIAFKRDEIFSVEKVGGVDFADYWKTAPRFCTQTNSTKICMLPPTEKMVAKRMTGYKAPNLGEAYKFFTGRDMQGAHRADADVDAVLAVYFGIQDHNAKLDAK